MSLLDFRDSAFQAIHDLASKDPNVYVLTNDMGAMGLDRLKSDFPDRVVNAGIAEQNMMSLASGLALEGKKVFVYGIISHIIQRAFEQIKLDICCPSRAVTLLGIGSGMSYGGDGPTHHGNQDLSLMHSLPGLTVYDPADAVTTDAAVKLCYESAAPGYVRLDKDQHQAIYEKGFEFYGEGCHFVVPKEKINIAASGILVHRAMQVAKRLRSKGIAVGVMDIFRTKPLNVKAIDNLIEASEVLLVLEEHTGIGGLSSLIEKRIAHAKSKPLYHSVSLADQFFLGCATRKWVQDKNGLSEEKVVQTLEELCARSL